MSHGAPDHDGVRTLDRETWAWVAAQARLLERKRFMILSIKGVVVNEVHDFALDVFLCDPYRARGHLQERLSSSISDEMSGSHSWVRSRAFMYVALGGLTAATLDIIYAWLFWWLKADVPIQRIFQSVAAGLLGKASFEGGALTAVLGLGLHYINAMIMSAAYFVVARREPALAGRPVLFGSVYGLLLYVIMNHVVIPLSAAGAGSNNQLWIVMTIVVHVVFVGIPIALAARRALQ